MSKEWEPTPDQQRAIDQGEEAIVGGMSKHFARWNSRLEELTTRNDVTQQELHDIIAELNSDFSFGCADDDEKFKSVELGYRRDKKGNWHITQGGEDLS